MRTYEIRLAVPSGFVTPWHADTIFGHLCWAAERQGVFKNFTGASGFIDLYRAGKPPLIISDAFPTGFLPAPANLRELFDNDRTATLDVSRYSLLKKVKGLEYLTIGQFRQYQKGESFDVADTEKQIVSAVTLHNQISRITNTTGDGGSLFELDEHYVKNGKLSIYAKIADGFEDDVLQLFGLFAASGYGKKKSAGKGAFAVEAFQTFAGFACEGKTNGFVVLSHFVPAQNDPTEGVYKSMVKYGKLGEEKALSGNPFKKPLLMLKPGAVFRDDGSRTHCGRLIEKIAYADDSVVQYAYGFCVPVTVN